MAITKFLYTYDENDNIIETIAYRGNYEDGMYQNHAVLTYDDKNQVTSQQLSNFIGHIEKAKSDIETTYNTDGSIAPKRQRQDVLDQQGYWFGQQYTYDEECKLTNYILTHNGAKRSITTFEYDDSNNLTTVYSYENKNININEDKIAGKCAISCNSTILKENTIGPTSTLETSMIGAYAKTPFYQGIDTITILEEISLYAQ